MSRMGELAMDIDEARALLGRGRPARYHTNRILELMDEGLLDPKDLVKALITWLSEDEVHDMAVAYELMGLINCEDEEDE